LVVALGLQGCGRHEAAPAGAGARPPATVTVVKASAHEVPEYLDEIGVCQATESVDIVPQVSGQLDSIGFKDGQDVAKGDLLFVIDKRPYEAKLAEQKAALAEAQANLDLAQVQFKRVDTAHTAGVSNASEYDQAKASVASGLAKVAAAQAAIDAAQVDLSFTEIRSPIDGRVGHVLVDAGNVIKALDKPLLRIERMTPIYAEFTTVEQNLAQVRQAMRANTLITEVQVPRQAESKRRGDLTFLDNAVMPQSGRVKLRATLGNEDRVFWPGQFVRVRLILHTTPDVVLVPYQATQLSQQGPYVYVVAGAAPAQKAELRPVTLGQRQGDDVVILTGLQAGETVVLNGQMTVSPDGPVRVVDDAAATAPTSQPATRPAGAQAADTGPRPAAPGTAGGQS
jgi:multidrug efflux system membrane fusion protein